MNWLERLIQKIKNALSGFRSPKPDPNAADHQFFKGLRWLRSDPRGPNARVTVRLQHAHIAHPGRLEMDAQDIGHWPAQGDTHGVMCAAVFRNGLWEGGKFDHVRKSTKVRDFNNIRGYLPIYPVSGETLRFWILNYAGTEASNVVESKWP
jgi:hypothetical protein